MADLPSNRRDPKDISVAKPRPAPGPQPDPGAASGAAGLPSGRGELSLDQALERLRDLNVPLEEVAREFGLDPDLLHRLHTETVKPNRKLGGGGDRFPSQAPVAADDSEREAFARNWDRAAEGVEVEVPPTSLENLLNIFPPLRLVLGSERRRFTVGVTVCLAAAFGVYSLSKRDVAPTETPTPTPTPPPVSPAGVVSLPSATDRDRAEELAHSFLAAAGWPAKEPLVATPESIAPLAAEWYSRPENRSRERAAGKIEFESSIGIVKDGHRYVISDVTVDGDRSVVVVRAPESGDYKVDWKATVRYSAKSWSRFIADRDTEASSFYVRCTRGDYFNSPFDDDHVYDSFRLARPLQSEEVLYGYVRKDDPLATYLAALTANHPRPKNLILKIRYPESGVRDCVEIVGVPADSWIQVPKK